MERRIDTIASFLFKQIYLDYASGIIDYCFASDKLKKYREVGHQLVQQLDRESRLACIERLEREYDRWMSTLDELHDQHRGYNCSDEER